LVNYKIKVLTLRAQHGILPVC